MPRPAQPDFDHTSTTDEANYLHLLVGAERLPSARRSHDAAANSMLVGVQAARSIPDPTGAQLGGLVKGAFLEGFHLASLTAGGVAAVAAIAGWLLLKPSAHSRASAENLTDVPETELSSPVS